MLMFIIVKDKFNWNLYFNEHVFETLTSHDCFSPGIPNVYLVAVAMIFMILVKPRY